MNRTDYVAQLEVTLKARSKFKYLGPADKYDKTALIQRKLNKALLLLKHNDELDEQELLDLACMTY